MSHRPIPSVCTNPTTFTLKRSRIAASDPIAVWHCYAVEVRWLQDLTDTPQYMLIVGVTWIAVTGVAMGGLLRLWGTGGAFLAVGVSIAVLVAWDRLIEQPKRGARRAAIGEAQQSPGTQALQSPEGDHAPHWGAWFPHPLDSVARFFPATVLVLAIMGVTLALNSLIGKCGSP